jgi:sugar lactone lactonase YvrE
VWVACPAGIRHFDRAGNQLEVIALSEPAVNCNWGEGFQDLYITAGTSVYRARVKGKGTRTY